MKIRTIISATLALTMIGATVAKADWEDDRERGRHHWEQNAPTHDRRNNDHRNDQRPQPHHWARGERLPDQYRNRQYEVTDWRARHWKKPPRGYHYVRTDDGDVVLAVLATGIIADILLSQR